MKRQARFIAQQAAKLDPSASKIFVLTRCTVILTLLVSLGMLLAAPLSESALALDMLAEGLFHAAFRIAAVGIALGFGADIAAKHAQR